MNLTVEEVRMLAKAQHMMDSGEKKYVIFGGNRMIVNDTVMDKFGLQHRQEIDWSIFAAIQQENINECQLKMQLNRIKNEASN